MNLTTGQKVMILLVLWLVLRGGVAGAPAPFVTDKPSVLIVEETQKRTTDLAGIMFAVETATKALPGNYRQLDANQPQLDQEDKWVQAAYAAWQKDKLLPGIVGANPKTGFKQALPASKDASVKLVQQLGGK